METCRKEVAPWIVLSVLYHSFVYGIHFIALSFVLYHSICTTNDVEKRCWCTRVAETPNDGKSAKKRCSLVSLLSICYFYVKCTSVCIITALWVKYSISPVACVVLWSASSSYCSVFSFVASLCPRFVLLSSQYVQRLCKHHELTVLFIENIDFKQNLNKKNLKTCLWSRFFVHL